MTPECLAHSLTEAERNQFEQEGFLIVPDALSPAMVEQLIAAVDQLHHEALQSGTAQPHGRWGCTNLIGRNDLFVELLDWPAVIPKVWGILGWNIYSYHTHAGVTPPAPSGDDQGEIWLEWHQDSGRVNIEMETEPRPRLSLKVAYFLTDVSQPGRGNFCVLPGSHLKAEIPPASEIGRDPQETVPERVPGEALPICVQPGTAVIFDRRLWHSRSPNHSQLTRKALFYGYSYRWLRPKDDLTADSVLDRCDPIRRQLLGVAVSNNGRYVPTDEDVPLRAWLLEHAGESAV
jgi:ectoine hydroxylase